MSHNLSILLLINIWIVTHFLIVVNKAAMNIMVKVLGKQTIISFENIPRNNISGS